MYCMCVYVVYVLCKCTLCMYVRMYICKFMYVCMYLYMCVCVYFCLSVRPMMK